MRRLTWFIRLWLAMRFAEFYIQPSLAVYKVKWTADDEEGLRNYLQSASGEKLQMVLLAHIQQTDQQAVDVATPRACGYATGLRSMLAKLISLSGHVPPQVDESESQDLQGIPRLRNPFPEPGNKKPENL